MFIFVYILKMVHAFLTAMKMLPENYSQTVDVLRKRFSACVVWPYVTSIGQFQGIVGCTPTNIPLLGNPYISPIWWEFMGYNPQESHPGTPAK